MASSRTRRSPGNVTSDGRLNIGTNASGTSNSVTFRFQLLGWETKLTSANQMTGKTAVSLSATGLVGNAYEEHNINNASCRTRNLHHSPNGNHRKHTLGAIASLPAFLQSFGDVGRLLT